MSNEKDIGFKSKKTTCSLAKNIQRVIPLVEEITKQKLLPICLIGFDVNNNGEIRAHFATISDDKKDPVGTYLAIF